MSDVMNVCVINVCVINVWQSRQCGNSCDSSSQPGCKISNSCPTFITQTFITPDIHHTMCKKGHWSHRTFITPCVKKDIDHTRHWSHQTLITPDIHHTGHSSHHVQKRTMITPDIHHTMCKRGHWSHQTLITSDMCFITYGVINVWWHPMASYGKVGGGLKTLVKWM